VIARGKLTALPKRALVRGTKTTLRLGSRGKPVPLAMLLKLRRFGGGTNMLTFRAAGVVRPGSALANPFLAERLADRRLGDWTISAQAMNMLEREIHARPPRRVLEFGSGLSTACLSRFMAENAPAAPRPSVVSVEQDVDFRTESRAVLEELGLDGLASVHHAPLAEREIDGRSVNAYDIPAAALAEIAAVAPDLVFIDGPGMAAGRFARWGVLHLVIPLLPGGFRFYLDDALSDSALECAKLWGAIPGVRIAGVALIGHGVLVGEYRV
jgi:Methyltransferase domain